MSKFKIITIIAVESGNNVLSITSTNPEGVTIRIQEENLSKESCFNLPRIKMIETLEHILAHLKADLES
jgi:hypothetical protein